MIQLKHKSFFISLILPKVWAVDTGYTSVHKLSYLDKTKAKVKIQTSFLSVLDTIIKHEDSLCNFLSGLAKWPPPVSYVFSTTVIVFNQMYYFLWIIDQAFLSSISSSSNVWKTVVKFLGIVAVLLIIQSWKDTAASQLR